jgi:hypothetical protein
MSTLDPRAFFSTNDSTLIDLVSPLLAMEEMMELKTFALARLRWTRRMVSRAARSWRASRSL